MKPQLVATTSHLDTVVDGVAETKFVMLSRAGDFVATLTMSYKGRVCADLKQLFVHEEYRRRRFGLNILCIACEAARKAGCSAAALMLNRSNRGLFPFYEKAGFVVSYEYADGDLILTRSLLKTDYRLDFNSDALSAAFAEDRALAKGSIAKALPCSFCGAFHGPGLCQANRRALVKAISEACGDLAEHAAHDLDHSGKDHKKWYRAVGKVRSWFSKKGSWPALLKLAEELDRVAGCYTPPGVPDSGTSIASTHRKD